MVQSAHPPSLPSSPQGPCCSSGWSLYPGSRTPPQTPARPSRGTGWCAPHAASSSPPCLPSPPPPSRYPLSEPAGQRQTAGRQYSRQDHIPSVGGRYSQSNSSPALGSSFHHDSGLHLVNEVEGYGPLADPHLLGFPVLVVLAPDAVNALL